MIVLGQRRKALIAIITLATQGYLAQTFSQTMIISNPLQLAAFTKTPGLPSLDKRNLPSLLATSTLVKPRILLGALEKPKTTKIAFNLVETAIKVKSLIPRLMITQTPNPSLTLDQLGYNLSRKKILIKRNKEKIHIKLR